MIGGISGSGGSMAQMQQMQGMRRQNQGERFNKLDADKNGGIDQTELQTMSDQISSVTGQQINIEEISKTFDTDNDGLLAQDEMQSMMMELRDKMGAGPQMQQNPMQALAAYQVDQDQDSTSTLLDMLGGDEEEDQEEYIPLNTQA
jgi:predicted S18 family serine protease